LVLLDNDELRINKERKGSLPGGEAEGVMGRKTKESWEKRARSERKKV
jgi:hypothetical protein